MSPTFSSEIFACSKINTTSHCVNHVCTLLPKLSSVKNKIRIKLDFQHFRIRSMHFDRKGRGIQKNAREKFRLYVTLFQTSTCRISLSA